MSARTLNARSLASLGALLVVFLLGLTYVLVGVVQFNPFNRRMDVTVLMPRSGGLLSTSPVSYRGYPVGVVRSIDLRPGGVRIVVAIDEGTRIPADTEVKVADLSAAGEQYLDFQPRTDAGPYLADGAVINPQDTHTPTPFGKIITDATTLVNQIDPAKLNMVTTEMSRAFNGSAPELQRILDGGNYVLTGLQGVLPQTVDLLHNSRTLLGTVYDLRGPIGRLAPSAKDLTGRLRDARPTIAELLDRAPDALDQVDDIARHAGPTLRDTFDEVDVTLGVLHDRMPALSLFLPGLISLGPTAQGFIHDGRINATADAYPKPTCDYGTPRRPPNLGGHLPPYLWRYCPTPGPRLLQRGAAAVPRPSGDHTAGPPRGVSPAARGPVEPGPPPRPRPNGQPAPSQAPSPVGLPGLGGPAPAQPSGGR